MAVTPLPSCLPQRAAFTGPEARSSGALRERAERLWTAKAEEDWATVFTFGPPGEYATREQAEFVAWSREKEPFRVQSYQIGRVLTDGKELGWVELDYSAAVRKYPDLPPRDAHRWQKWFFVTGEWYPIPLRELSLYPESPVLRNAVEEARLLERFKEAWTAKHDGNWHQLYELTDPRDREDVSEDQFAEVEGAFEYLSYDLHWVQVISDRGNVRVSYRHDIADPSLAKLPPRTLSIAEDWVKYEGEWYRDLKGS
jgi:hypothetical protein